MAAEEDNSRSYVAREPGRSADGTLAAVGLTDMPPELMVRILALLAPTQVCFFFVLRSSDARLSWAFVPFEALSAAAREQVVARNA